MAILLNETTKVLIQGITGGEGRKAAAHMKNYHTLVLCGVTPGKGGQDVDGIPVYNTVAEACAKHSVTASLIMVPPLAAKSAVLEALHAGISLIVCVTENVPLHDAASMIAEAQNHSATLIGPGSIGIISPGFGRMGPIGGPLDILNRIYQKGNIGVLSRSGGMTNEISLIIRQAGLGQSTAIGIGGEQLIGTPYAEALKLFEADPQTHAVAIFGELGGTYEDQIITTLKKKEYTKPLAIFIAGNFAEKLPQGQQFGHAGAVIEHGKGKPSQKIKRLKKAGVLIAQEHTQLGDLIRGAL